MSLDDQSSETFGGNPSQPNLQQRWITIDTKALAGNLKAIKAVVSESQPAPKLMAVVKADGYGHGAAKIALSLRNAGADWFGVTTLDEAMQLVAAGIDSRDTPILLFAPLTNFEQATIALENSLHLTVADRTQMAIVVAAAVRWGIRENLHLKVDTGMGRLGLNSKDAFDVAQASEVDRWAGAYTHFPNASDKDIAQTRWRVLEFASFCGKCKEAGIDLGTVHCANSAAALRLPESRMGMVRIGTALYGQMPSRYVPKPAGWNSDTFQMQARVVFTRELKPGDTASYGSEFVAKRLTKTAVLPVGFADGFGVSPDSLHSGWRGVKQILTNSRPYVLINGRRANVIGRVAMQMIIVDVTDFSAPVQIGDIADIPIRRLAASALIPRRYE